jgi:hypothetical protein
MTPKKLKLAGGKQSRNTANTGDAQAAPAVTPAIADAAAEIQSLIASQTRSGKVDVGSDFQMRLARAEDRLVAELKRAGLPPITPRKPRADGTEFTQTDLAYRQGESNQSHRCVFVPDAKWRDRLSALSLASAPKDARPRKD